jgi:hypothetical protein
MRFLEDSKYDDKFLDIFFLASSCALFYWILVWGMLSLLQVFKKEKRSHKKRA